MLIDSHAHLCDESFQGDLDKVIERAKDAGIDHIVNIATNPFQLEKGIALKKRFPWIHNVAATTPHDVDEKNLAIVEFEKQVQAGHLVAIGETGLDYYYEHAPKALQIQSFRLFIALAKKAHLPLVIHCREAFFDLFNILEEEGFSEPVLLHCFTGSQEEAQEAIKRGFYLSFSGIVTFKKNVSLQQVAQLVPLEKMIIETDCPYLAPQSKRGKRNEPSFLLETAEFMAALKEISLKDFCQQVSANTKSFFNLIDYK